MYILSKLAGGVDYSFYRKNAAGKMVRDGFVRVKGGADVADKKTLQAPDGVVTEVTEAEAKKLEANPVFQKHKKAGLVKTVKTAPAKKAGRDLAADKSRQVTPADYKEEGKQPPATGAVGTD
jgi:16S rRNA U516 pseudouridylate synthase RsuA-like enzyme